jgi:hypothetical protein
VELETSADTLNTKLWSVRLLQAPPTARASETYSCPRTFDGMKEGEAFRRVRTAGLNHYAPLETLAHAGAAERYSIKSWPLRPVRFEVSRETAAVTARPPSGWIVGGTRWTGRADLEGFITTMLAIITPQ